MKHTNNIISKLSAAVLVSFGTADLAQQEFGQTLNDYRTPVGVVISLSQEPDQEVQLKVGDKFPEIELPGPGGTLIKLSEVASGKMVLIDFWATWCGPCRSEIPEVRATHAEMQDKLIYDRAGNLLAENFEVFSVCDNFNEGSSETWKALIESGNMKWVNVESTTANFPQEKFGVIGYPSNFLLAPDGTILKINVHVASLPLNFELKEKKQ